MNVRLPPGDDLTVVFLPQTPAAEEIVALAREWTAGRLLRPACWSTGAQVSRLDSDPPTALTTVLDDEDATAVDLFAAVAGHRRRLVRYVAVHPLPEADAADPAFVKTCLGLGEWIGRQLPVDPDGGVPRATRFLRVSLIVPASGVQAVDPRVAVEGWDAAVVAAPEDRRSPLHAADFVRPDGNFAGHALLHVAAVGGLLTAVGVGTFDEPVREPSASYGRSVTVVRTWARAVIGERTTDELADAAMAGLTAREAVPPGADAVFVPSSRPDVLVREVVDELLRADGGALGYEAPRCAPDPGKRPTTFREAVAELVRFTRSALAMFLNRLAMRLLRQAERTLTGLTYGARGSGEVRLVPERGEALVNAAQRTIEDVRRSARAGLGTSRSGLIVPATPQLWAAVRGGVLGLLDGEMPVPFQSPRQGTRREIILDRGRVLPAPNERFVVGDRAAAVLGLADDEREITPVDARRAAALSFRLDRCARRLAELRGDEAGRDVRGEALGSHHPLAETLDEYAETLSEPDDDALAALDDVSRELAGWRAARARCLAWQLSARVGEGLDRAAGDVKHLEQAELAATPALDPSAVERARRGFLRSTALVAVSLVVALVLVWWHWRPDLGPRWIVRVYATGAVVSLAAVVEALVLPAYYRAHSAFERQLNIRLHRIREAVTAASRVRNEQARLTGMYDQLVTWLAILSQVADGPWSLEQPPVPTYRPCLDPVRLPAALAVATPDEDRRGPRFRERAAAITVIARPGWLGSAYRELVDIALADLGDDVTYRLDLLDADGPTSTNRSRRILADALDSGEPQRVLAQRVRDTVAREAFPDNAALVGDSVVPLGADARPCAVRTFLGDVLEPPTAFSHAIWSSEALVGKLQAKSRCVVWAPAALRSAGAGAGADGDPDGDPDGGHRQIDRRTVRGHGDGVLSAAMRCDYSPVAPLAYLTLFAAALHPPSPSLSPPLGSPSGSPLNRARGGAERAVVSGGRRRAAMFCTVPLLLVGCASSGDGLPDGALGPYPVVRVVDGDTVRVTRDSRTVTLRLIGIDTPETKDPRRPVECFGREASRHARELLASRRVYLEFDRSQGERDRYGRTLAYVWLRGNRATLVNERMIDDGFAFEYTYRLPYRYQRRFRAAEADARRHSRGLWSQATCGGDPDRPAR